MCSKAFASAFISYYLIKLVPLWGLTLLATNLVFLGPLVYSMNKELIDGQLNNANEIMQKQTSQVRGLAGQYTGKAQEHVSAYTKQASDQISGMIGSKKAPTSKDYPKTPANDPLPTAPQGEFGASANAQVPQPVVS